MATFEVADKQPEKGDVKFNKQVSKFFLSLPVEEDHAEPMETKVRGTIPEWLTGNLLRNGQGLYKVGEQQYKHYFDGLALLHRFNISNGKVTYQNKFLRSDDYKEAIGANRIAMTGFGTYAYPDPCKSIFHRLFSHFKSRPMTDNDSVALVKIGEDFYAMTETPYIRKIDPKTLDALGDKIDISKVLAVNGASAHCHTDPDGTVYNMGIKYGKYSSYNIIKIPPPDKGVEDPYQKASIICSVPSHGGHPSYFHSFGMSEKYIIFVEQPVIINVWKLLASNLLSWSFVDTFEFYPEWPNRFRVINRETGQALETRFIADSFFTFHHVNAYEKDGHLVVDLCGYSDVHVLKRLYMDDLQSGGDLSLVHPWRFVLPLNIEETAPVGENLVTLEKSTATAMKLDDGSIHCTYEKIIDVGDDESVELPRINYSMNGKEYRYAYSMGGVFAKLVKWDVLEKSYKEWSAGNDAFPSEPVFVPKPGATKEDEGIVLSSVMTVGENNPSFLLILDAESFTEIARAEVPVHITLGLHGIFEKE